MSFTVFLLWAAGRERKKLHELSINGRGFFFCCENYFWKIVFNWRVYTNCIVSRLLSRSQCLLCERPLARVQHTWSVNRHLDGRRQWLVGDKNGMEIPQLVLLNWWSLAASVRPTEWIYSNVQHTDTTHTYRWLLKRAPRMPAKASHTMDQKWI